MNREEIIEIVRAAVATAVDDAFARRDGSRANTAIPLDEAGIEEVAQEMVPEEVPDEQPGDVIVKTPVEEDIDHFVMHIVVTGDGAILDFFHEYDDEEHRGDAYWGPIMGQGKKTDIPDWVRRNYLHFDVNIHTVIDVGWIERDDIRTRVYILPLQRAPRLHQPQNMEERNIMARVSDRQWVPIGDYLRRHQSTGESLFMTLHAKEIEAIRAVLPPGTISLREPNAADSPGSEQWQHVGDVTLQTPIDTPPRAPSDAAPQMPPQLLTCPIVPPHRDEPDGMAPMTSMNGELTEASLTEIVKRLTQIVEKQHEPRDWSPREPTAKLVDPGKYDGKNFKDAEPWYERMIDWRAKFPSMSEATFLSHLTDRLDGTARKWFTDRRRTATALGRTPFIDAEDFRTHFLRHHRQGNVRSTARAKLMMLTTKKPSTVAALHEKFLELIADVPNMSLDERCSLFTSALQPQVCMQLKLTPHWAKLEDPLFAQRGTIADFNEFVRLAFEAESAMQDNNARTSAPPWTRMRKPSFRTPTRDPVRVNAVKQVKYNLKKHITPDERLKRLQQRRCLICGSDKHMMRDCTDPIAKTLRINAISMHEDAFLDNLCDEFLDGAGLDADASSGEDSPQPDDEVEDDLDTDSE